MTPRNELKRLKTLAVALLLGSFIGPAGAIAVIFVGVLLLMGAFGVGRIRERRSRMHTRKRVAMMRDVRGRFAVAREPTAQDYAEAWEEVEETLRRKG